MKLCSNIFQNERKYLGAQLKDTKRQTRNMKLASIFFKTNGSILEHKLKDTKRQMRNMKLCFNIFQNEQKVIFTDIKTETLFCSTVYLHYLCV